jgi:hypothetical protein
MLTPQEAEWFAGRVVTANQERDAQQLADLRASLARCRERMVTPFERLQALFGRSQHPATANSDCGA